MHIYVYYFTLNIMPVCLLFRWELLGGQVPAGAQSHQTPLLPSLSKEDLRVWWLPLY